jgi:predicted RNA-binding Zn ribbon-like protein
LPEAGRPACRHVRECRPQTYYNPRLRSPIPTDWAVEPCLDLINSRFNDHLGSGEVYDRLSEPRFRRAFLERWRFEVGDPDDSRAVPRLRRLRTLLREVLETYIVAGDLTADLRTALEVEMNRAPLRLGLEQTRDGYELAMRRSGREWDGVMAEIATSAARLIAEQRRVKVCANSECSWMFVDQSRPGTRRWCNVGVCGSLMNVRHFRAARAG